MGLLKAMLVSRLGRKPCWATSGDSVQKAERAVGTNILGHRALQTECNGRYRPRVQGLVV